MTTVPARPFSPAHAVASANAAANRLLLALLRSPAGRLLGRRLAVVEYTGRRTGRVNHLVVIYVIDGTQVRIDVAMAQDKTWWRNFEEPRPLRLRLAGTDHEALAHVVSDGHRVRVIAELEQAEAARVDGPRPPGESSAGGSA
jgi:hypothetical protein